MIQYAEKAKFDRGASAYWIPAFARYDDPRILVIRRN
jgi:hypothetical protein